MRLVRFLLSVALLSASLNTFSFELDNKSIGAAIKNMKLDKAQISGMVDMLVSSGQITKKQADEVKARLNKMSDKDLENLKLDAVKFIDSGEAEKQLTPEHKKTIEQYKKELSGDSPFKKMVDEELKKQGN
jgi:hypothetical protein